jgi:6-phosphogluconolactonase
MTKIDRPAHIAGKGVASATRLWVGTYEKAGGRGLYPIDVDRNADLLVGAPIGAALNASFGCYSEQHGLLYLVDESDPGRLGTFRRDGDGWSNNAWAESFGSAPCFAALSPNEGAIAVANYESGTLALFALDPETGEPLEQIAVHQNAGCSIHERQTAPHAHCARFTPDGRWLYQTDLGTDEVLAFRTGIGAHLGARTVALATPAGAGPRHLLFSARAPLAWLLSELDSSITLLRVGDGKLETIERVSALPGDFDGESLGGDIAVNESEDRLYVTNRGHDSIGVFDLDAAGRPSPRQFVSSGGRSPRHLVLREGARDLLVANEKDSTIVRFDLAPDGTLEPAGMVEVPGAAFIIEA